MIKNHISNKHIHTANPYLGPRNASSGRHGLGICEIGSVQVQTVGLVVQQILRALGSLRTELLD